MSEEAASSTERAPGVMGRPQRRISLARALESFMAVIRRRGGKKRPRSVDEVVSPLPARREEAAEAVVVEKAPSIQEAVVVESQSGPDVKVPKAEQILGLEVDDDDQDEVTLFPVSNEPYRVGLSEEKAKLLFDRSGLTYQPRPAQEPPNKVRRVEKPVRLRLHWSCHHCDSVFAQERTCSSCGHRRCQDCARTPPQRVRLVSESTQKLKEADEAQDALALPSSSRPGGIGSRDDITGSVPTIANLTQPPPWLKADETRTTVTADPSTFLFTFQSSRDSGVQVLHQSRALLVERTCHKCHTPIPPAGRSDCEACGHIRCNRCTRDVHKPVNLGSLPASNSKAKAAPVLERVYRKPRQRVRWTCDRCHAPFRERDRCSDCGHEKCEDCIRDPVKKPNNLTPDPMLLRSVEEKLAAMRPQQQQASLLAV